jgi:hypothetical protein
MAAVWSDADLTSVRGRIPVSEANHVVCTLKQAIDYVSDIAKAISKLEESPSTPEYDNAAEQISALESLETSDAPLQEVLDRIVQEVAKSMYQDHETFLFRTGGPCVFCFRPRADGYRDAQARCDLHRTSRGPAS